MRCERLGAEAAVGGGSSVHNGQRRAEAVHVAESATMNFFETYSILCMWSEKREKINCQHKLF
jgi:hypothetical protein